MIAKNLFTQIRKAKGPILVSITNFDDVFEHITNFDDVFYVQVSKKDLMVQLSARFNQNDETGFILDENGYLDKDYGSQLYNCDRSCTSF